MNEITGGGIMGCTFPYIRKALDNGEITVETIAEVIEEDIAVVTKKLRGEDEFDINEAMKININLFPEVPFKALFSNNIY